MVSTAKAAGSPAEELVAPSEAEWRAMSPQQRRDYLERLLDALQERRDFMSEGRPHSLAKNSAFDKLGRHFRRIGRRVYLATELPVLYPGEPVVTPDLMAVLDVDDPGDKDERMSWVVADEGKGPELVLEVHVAGNERKDFVENVSEYARLGVQEFFIYDRRRQVLHGYRLPTPGARQYQKLRARFGRLTSEVLGLDLQIHEGRLRFYYGEAELPGSEELIERVQEMVDDIDERRSEAEARAEEERVRAEEALGELRAAVVGLLIARALPIPAEIQSKIASCPDPGLLRRWILRAATVASAEEVVE